MYGMIVKITAVAGKRAALTDTVGGLGEMNGCLSYVVSDDAQDENAIWITEVWDSESNHRASLSLPSVQRSISAAKPMIAGFEKIAVTRPVRGIGQSFSD
jgi:quinol monooxygenase YgiN